MQYAAWKYIVIAFVLVISLIYAIPNLYPDQPAIQITGASAGTQIPTDITDVATDMLQERGLTVDGSRNLQNSAILKLNTPDDQIKAREILSQELGDDYVVALNLAQTTPEWLRSLGATPVKLGLDLRGGVRFVLEVDMGKAVSQRLQTATSDIRRELRKERIPTQSLKPLEQGMLLQFSDAQTRDKAERVINGLNNDFSVRSLINSQGPALSVSYTDAKLTEISQYALGQNLTTLRNRINELGVADAVVQSQGSNRIVVELPGVQDTAEAKRVLGRTANLQFHLLAENADAYTGGIAPPGTAAYPFGSLDGLPVLLKKESIATGEHVQNAQSGFDQESGGAQVNITLDSAGGKLMQHATSGAVGDQMAVLFIENKQKIEFEIDPNTGKKVEVRTPYDEAKIINRATIQAVLGSSFRITGLDSPAEAAELALLLRSGALAAPMYFVEERTVGPSLGKENIEKGMLSLQIGFGLVAVLMIVFYRMFGLIANIALLINVAMIMAIMSVLGAALSLPGIAGIVLTVGMAVDANVLIFERIREEIDAGARPKSAIVAGFDRAFSTIFDTNITTFIVAFILFAIGTGPVKGFAVTLSIGILCSMFTAIMVTRAITQLVYGKRKRIEKLSIG